MHYSPPSLSERAAAFDAIAAVISEYLPGGVSPAVAVGQIIAIVDLTGLHQDDADQLDLPLAA